MKAKDLGREIFNLISDLRYEVDVLNLKLTKARAFVAKRECICEEQNKTCLRCQVLKETEIK